MAVLATSAILARSTSVRLEARGFVELPNFLCPALLRPIPHHGKQPRHSNGTLRPPNLPLRKRYFQHDVHPILHKDGEQLNSSSGSIRLPWQCAGCGALSQTLDERDPGFYSLRRKSVKEYTSSEALMKAPRRTSEDPTFDTSIHNLDGEVPKALHVDSPISLLKSSITPICDRCHKLLHHHNGTSIQHPSIKSIQDTIFESPHKYNHVYHVLDAADFPMSLIPRLHNLLYLTPQRSLNRRSKTGKFYHGRETEISFIITRSDLLAPLKSQVDSLMPYLVQVLRDALGSVGRNIRLGNVRCVSAKRGWWTKEVKEDVWHRGGGGWMVGKVNVGKSQLFESVFPKGKLGTVKLKYRSSQGPQFERENSDITLKDDAEIANAKLISTSSLLPPVQVETEYPSMPLVSPLPGTTASPIRIPFGNGKGELVDLPGLSRGDLELQVQEAHRSSLVMRSRIVPRQQVLKPGQSLLIGGFIRITPTTPDTIFMAYAFTPIEAHLTSTPKAIDIQSQQTDSTISNISIPGTGTKTRSAGKFPLKWDVTKQRSGPITAHSAAGIKIDQLPYRVLSTDILIEGCGWVELVAQVRRRAVERQPTATYKAVSEVSKSEASPPSLEWPTVEIFSPEGRFIGARRPMGAWLIGGERKSSRLETKSRPRQSMKGVKRKMKVVKRMAEA